MRSSVPGPLGGPTGKTQGPTAGTLDPRPPTLALPLVGRGGGATSVAGDIAYLVVFVEAEAAYTPSR